MLINKIPQGKQSEVERKMLDEKWMAYALELAKQAGKQDEVPVGAVVVQDDKLIGEGFNCPIQSCDPTSHAEVKAIQDACINTNNYRLVESTLYVTLEPCTMCFGALIHARIQRLVFAAYEPKAGVITSRNIFEDNSFLNHTLYWNGGVMAEESSQLLTHFFKAKRALKQKEKKTKK